MRKFFTCIAFMAASAWADTTTITETFEWKDSITCAHCTREKVFIVKVPGVFQLGSMEEGPNGFTGSYRVSGSAGSLPVLIAPGERLRVSTPTDTSVFNLKAKKTGWHYVRFIADPPSSTGTAPKARTAPRLPASTTWKGFNALGRWRASQAPR